MDKKLEEIIPQSIAQDKTVQDLCKVLDEEILPIATGPKKALVYSRIDSLPIEAVDLLAWQFHVDVYDIATDDAAKRRAVKDAIRSHRYKGTPWALKQAIRRVLADGDITEWQEYSGKPYYFKVTTAEGLTSAKHLQDLLRVVADSKNVRSWLDGIAQTVNGRGIIYTSGRRRMQRKMTIYPSERTEWTNSSTIYVGIVRHEIEETEIRGDFRGDLE
jgi:phage tail P2-like protein|nr:MAG TPA: tail protein [Caudoviricetes sp.]